MTSINPVYRNRRKLFYSDKGPDTLTVGSIINVLKIKDDSNSYDRQFSPTITSVNGTSSYIDDPGGVDVGINPDYQYDGYLYCDGSEYFIKDYPLLFSVIGTEYGGEANNGVVVENQGNNYSSNTEVTFSPPQDVNGTTATGEAVVENGKIIRINVLNQGTGYNTPPTITLTNTGSGSGAVFRVRIRQGTIAAITKENVFEFWPDEELGTFFVPDLKAKKIVGRGPVYGTGTPSIGNIEIQVGKNTIGGKWYLDKNSQKGQFNIGTVRTTGYENVTDSVPGNIIGSQTISVELQDSRLKGSPQHDHFLLHSECPQEVPGRSGRLYDSYITGYRTTNGRIEQFSPSGGVALTHSHSLVRRSISDASVATYDQFNFTGGDIGPGTIKSNGNYYSSGSGSGTFELVTFTPSPTFRPFGSNSLIGGREINTQGTPIFAFTSQDYSSPGNYSYTIPSNIDDITFIVYGGGGSGAVYDRVGNTGGFSRVTVGLSTQLTITAGGGLGGGAAGDTTGGPGGLGGSNAFTGTLSSSLNISENQQGNTANLRGGDGRAGRFWFLTNPQPPTPDPGGTASATGSAGRFLTVSEFATLSDFVVTYPSTASFSVLTSNENYGVDSVTIDVYGARGADNGNMNRSGYNCGTQGSGGAGKFFSLRVKNPTLGSSFGFFPGQSGRPYPNNAVSTTGTATGGRGGDGFQSNDGGGGGAGTIITAVIGATTQIVAGAGGGGGGGGHGEGVCGLSAVSNTPYGDGVYIQTTSLFSGGGAPGGAYGCEGGGGGGGGGGVGLSSQVVSGAGPGGGGGGPGGHGGGDGGGRGISSIRGEVFDLLSQGLVNHDAIGTVQGRLVGRVRENRGYYSSGGGGAGSGGRITATINGSEITQAGISSVAITVGAGATGVSRNIANSNTITSSSGSAGFVNISTTTIVGFEGGTTSISIGDIVKSASAGVQILSTGTGTGTTGGFKLPTTQVPTVVISPQGDGPGSGATATATVTNGIVSSLTLNNGGLGYIVSPKVRFLHGAGSGALGTTNINNNGSVTNLELSGTQIAYSRYVRFMGTERERFIIIQPFDCTNVEKFAVKAARGNGYNGGDRPDDSADELRVYWNDDGSNNFPEANFIGVLVPRPTDAQVANGYDGTGSGNEATRWYTYEVPLPEQSQTSNVQFKIVQSRTTPSGANDNAADTDHYGICDIIYDYKLISDTVFVRTEGEISSNSKKLSYTIEGSANSAYPSGIGANDIRFTMSSGVPILPRPFLDPQINVPLVEPYALTKYLIKAY
jgi:hypothetical protein